MRCTLLCLLFTVVTVTVWAQKDCRNEQYQLQLLANNPQLAQAYEKVELFTRQLTNRSMMRDLGSPSNGPIVPEIITIPVVVHILWNNNAQNISDAQILSQIAALNDDFNAKNSDKNKIPSYFQSLAADCGFRFELAKTDPKGMPTSGIVRRWTNIQNFGYDDRAKHSSIGGDDAWDASSYLNIWVCNTVGGLLGYSSIPGAPKDNDGVVINTNVFGTINVGGVFNKGRTTVHEVGHWLNLRHIWGDMYCGNDNVDDTPTQQGATRGCPGGQKFTCGSTAHGDLYMDFMDLTDDACMLMFTNGQRERMRALFAPGGARNAMLASTALSGPGLPQPAAVAGGETESIISLYSISIFPNPTSSAITIQSQESLNCIGKMVSIYNHLGQVVTTTTLQAHNQRIDVSRLQSGVYFIRIAGVKTDGMAKFVKQ
jgi:hypothetical protein